MTLAERLLPRPSDLGPMLLLALGYAALVLFGLNWAVVSGAGSSVWPAAGLALAALLIGGARLWPGVLAGRLLAAALVGSPQPWWGDLLIAVGTTAGALLPALMRQPPLDTLKGVLWLGLVGAGAGATLSAGVGVAVLAAAGTPAERLAPAALNWWSGFAVGVLLVAPPILAWSRRTAWAMPAERWLHLVVILLATLAASAMVFTDALPTPWRSWVIFPLLGWAALAFDVRGASAALLIVAGFALNGAVEGTGFMAYLSPLTLDRVLDSQQFVATAALTSLALAAVADERRRFEPAARLGAIVDSAGEAIVSVGADARVHSWNPAAAALFGITEAEVAGRTLPELAALWNNPLHPDLLPLFGRVLAGERVRAELQLFHRDGSPVPVSLTGAPVFGARGRIDGAAAVLRDLRPQLQAEAARRASEELLRLVVRAGGIGCFDWDPATGLGHCSPEYLALHGLPPDATPLTTERWTALIHPDDRADVWAAIDAAQSGGAAAMTNEHRIIRADTGETRWLMNRSELFRDQQGRLTRVVGAQFDITDRKFAELELQRLNQSLEAAVEARTAELLRAEEALRQSQKMESLGQLTGGVAHDFNNLLTPIIGGLDMLKRRVADPPAAKLVEAALASAERARTLVQRLLAFARRQVLSTEDVDVAAMVDSLRDVLARTLGPGVRLALDVAAGLPPVRVDRNQAELALINLCVNARDAMPDGGALTIAARREEDFVRLAVADTGQGMDAATLRRAAEPFFSTKPVGKGTGLGLSMVHGLAEQSGGRMEIASAPGGGTTVALLLPVGGSAPISPREAVAPAMSQGARLLLVDDDAEVRSATAAMLEALGHAVEQVGSGGAALALLDAGAAFDAVVTDQQMPGMTGGALAGAVATRRPGLPVLLVTGFAGAPPPEGQPVLMKPFRLADLAAALEPLLAMKAEAG